MAGRAEAKVYVVADARQARRALSQLSGDASRTGTLFKSALGGVATAGVAALGAGIVAAGAAMAYTGVRAVQLAADMEMQTIAFTTLLGSAKKATTFLKELEKFSASTPFQFSDVVAASKHMLAFGWNVKRIIPDLTAMGNAVAAMGGSPEMIDRVVTALGQMRMKGKMSAEEMMQLSEANINAWGYVADALGVSVKKAMELGEQGKISGDIASDAILKGMAADKKFKGMMAAQSKTLSGMWSNLKDTWDGLLRAIGKILIKTLHLKDRLRDLTEWMGRFRQAVEKEGLAKAAEKMVPGIRQASQWWKRNQKDIIAVGKGIIGVIRWLAKYGPILQRIQSFFNKWVNPLGVAIRIIRAIWEAASKVVGPAKEVASALKSWSTAGLDAVLGAIRNIISAAETAYGWIQKVLSGQGGIHPGSGPATRPSGGGRAFGGISTGPMSGYSQTLHGTELTIPLNGNPFDPSRNGGLSAAGKGGGTVVNIYLEGVFSDGLDAGEAAAEAFVRRSRQLAMGY